MRNAGQKWEREGRGGGGDRTESRGESEVVRGRVERRRRGRVKSMEEGGGGSGDEAGSGESRGVNGAKTEGEVWGEGKESNEDNLGRKWRAW